MFKYGGPIKEGIMHSMKNGGTAGVGHGLVGDQRYPKTGGREHHGFFLPALYSAGAAALRYLPNIYRGIKAGKYVKGWKPTSTFRRVPGRDPSAAYIKGDPSAFAGSPASRMGMWKALGDPKRLGAAIRENPGTALTLGSLGATGASRLFGSEPDPINIRTKSGVPGGGDPGMYYDKPPVTKSAAELAAEAKAARKAKIAKYMDTMGYDRAQKTAVGKALIDASAIVQAGTEEGGSLKHADWGKMINQAIQATSKRLDKPAQIREAIGLMMTKADIQKDMSAEENALAKLLTTKRIEKLNKELEGNSFRENLVAVSKTMQGQDAINTAVQLTEGKNFRGNIINVSDFNKILKKMKEETGLDDKTLIINYSQAEVDKNPEGFEDGHYTIGNNVITVKDSIVIAVE